MWLSYNIGIFAKGMLITCHFTHPQPLLIVSILLPWYSMTTPWERGALWALYVSPINPLFQISLLISYENLVANQDIIFYHMNFSIIQEHNNISARS